MLPVPFPLSPAKNQSKQRGVAEGADAGPAQGSGEGLGPLSTLSTLPLP